MLPLACLDAVDGWNFKQYVLGTLFYRFISENFANYIEGGDDSINYAELSDEIITPEIKEDAIKTKGYFIYPSQLFTNIAKGANTNDNLNYEFLISNYAANAGKSWGEFFTPQHVSRLIAQLAMHKQESVNKIYDPAALLLQAKKHFDDHIIEDSADNDYNLSVSSYVERPDTREKIDITQLNAELKTTVEKIDRLRADIDAIVAEIEGDCV